jgi:hypothetical protein
VQSAEKQSRDKGADKNIEKDNQESGRSPKNLEIEPESVDLPIPSQFSDLEKGETERVTTAQPIDDVEYALKNMLVNYELFRLSDTRLYATPLEENMPAIEARTSGDQVVLTYSPPGDPPKKAEKKEPKEPQQEESSEDLEGDEIPPTRRPNGFFTNPTTAVN